MKRFMFSCVVNMMLLSLLIMVVAEGGKTYKKLKRVKRKYTNCNVSSKQERQITRNNGTCQFVKQPKTLKSKRGLLQKGKGKLIRQDDGSYVPGYCNPDQFFTSNTCHTCPLPYTNCCNNTLLRCFCSQADCKSLYRMFSTTTSTPVTKPSPRMTATTPMTATPERQVQTSNVEPTSTSKQLNTSTSPEVAPKSTAPITKTSHADSSGQKGNLGLQVFIVFISVFVLVVLFSVLSHHMASIAAESIPIYTVVNYQN